MFEYGRRVALQGNDSFYRAKAYRTAAEQIAQAGEALPDLIEHDALTTLPGIGEAIAGLVERLYRTGTDPKLERMRAEVPASVLEFMELPGIRPEQALKLYRVAGIETLNALEAALAAGSLTTKKDFSAALQRKLLDGIKIYRQHRGARLISRAWSLAQTAIENLQASAPGLTRLTVSGECRRSCELVTEISIVAVDPQAKGESTHRFSGMTVQTCPESKLGATLLFATGSAAHLEILKDMAASSGLRLTPEGLKKGNKIVAAKSEADIYRALGLPYIEPELREGSAELEIAGRTPCLVSLSDLKGVLHAHTNASDGADTLEDMAEAARIQGFQYFGVTDHSQSAHYAGGMKPEEIADQQHAVERLNRRYGSSFRVFKGVESDIKPDGNLDYPEEILNTFDFVVASVHGQFQMSREAQTARIIKAVMNPYTTILGHMTGRQLLRRPGYDVDVEAVLAACAKHGVAVEINCSPWRLDLDWRWHQAALKAGCLTSIDPDAHSVREIDMLRWGVGVARKGGVPPGAVLTCFDRQRIEKHFRKRKALLSSWVAL